MMEKVPHILVVDDSREIREPLAKYLTKMSLRVSVAGDGKAMRQILAGAAIDLVILDVMLPGESGLELCRDLHESGTPVIMLTAMTEEADRIVGLEMGADDYVCKPFSPRELLARIKGVLRRAGPGRSQSNSLAGKRVRFDKWVFDLTSRELVGPDGVSMALSAAEFRLLEVLAERPGQTLNRDQLLDLSVGRAAEPFDRSIDNIVSRLRKKIEDDPKTPRIIKTVWGEGYCLSVPVEEAGAR
ncbi:MAG TPA: response regulator [Candidatus Sulfotelmatobacter sp.]|jgi:two-component system OmpR family response regulator|nr:response regulator [Candidatus Sulfotelmatobacter sp.]